MYLLHRFFCVSVFWYSSHILSVLAGGLPTLSIYITHRLYGFFLKYRNSLFDALLLYDPCIKHFCPGGRPRQYPPLHAVPSFFVFRPFFFLRSSVDLHGLPPLQTPLPMAQKQSEYLMPCATDRAPFWPSYTGLFCISYI